MPSDFPSQTITLYQAKQALEENLNLLSPATHKAVHNLTIALMGIARGLERLQNDHELLHNKIQPILKYLEEENNDWRDRYTTPES
ncbi:MAG: hypothetical protein EPN75_13255 [Beijerinckiaceae bacterium]|nr:MAG: hypothetical protein EPN75_13255 [Beijerinckiaceae bacterium]